MATVNKLVAALDAREIPIVVGDDETEPDPSLGEESQTAIQPTTGKVWVMTGGVWVFLGIYKAFRPRGAYDNAATYYYPAGHFKFLRVWSVKFLHPRGRTRDC
ncbi:hypothetical protein ACVIU4_004024 [Bradyrhizobium barranii subsp. barranii]